MKIQFIRFCILILIIGVSFLTEAQTNVSLKLSTLSYQFTETQPDLLKLNLTSNGKLAIEPGLIFSFEAYASSNTALKISQAVIIDKATHLAGATQIMIKFRVAKSFKHALYMAIGPAFHYRKTWADMNGYIDEPVYTTSGDWQHKFSWLSGEIEYNYYLNKMTDLSISLNHIQAESIGLAVGLKFWINKKPRKKRGCISCPGLH